MNEFSYPQLSKTSECERLLADTSEAWYWIGFLMADGHFDRGKIELSLAEKDKSHMEKFSKFIKYNKELKEIPIRLDTLMKQKQFTMHTNNIVVAEYLREKFDLSNRKTYEPPNFSKIKSDDDLFFSLFVGFTDGDGNIGNIKNRNCKYLRIRCHKSWENNLRFFENFLFRYFDLKKKQEHTKINAYNKAEFRIGRTDILIKIRDKCKELNLPYLERKWSKLESLSIKESSWSIEEKKILLKEKERLESLFPNRTWSAIKGQFLRIK